MAIGQCNTCQVPITHPQSANTSFSSMSHDSRISSLHKPSTTTYDMFQSAYTVKVNTRQISDHPISHPHTSSPLPSEREGERERERERERDYVCMSMTMNYRLHFQATYCQKVARSAEEVCWVRSICFWDVNHPTSGCMREGGWAGGRGWG